MKLKIFLSSILLITIFGAVLYLNTADEISVDKITLAALDKYMNEKPHSTDFFESYGWDGTVEDIRFYSDEEQENLEIKFGDVSFNIKQEELLSKENLDALERVGITFKRNKTTGRLSCYWRDVKLPEYVQ